MIKGIRLIAAGYALLNLSHFLFFVVACSVIFAFICMIVVLSNFLLFQYFIFFQVLCYFMTVLAKVQALLFILKIFL
jgi:hypothetical protein